LLSRRATQIRPAHAPPPHLREPGALSQRSIALLRGAVPPQLDAALAMLADGYPADTLARWNAFRPALRA
jgi:hypothetical protein